MDKLKFSAQQHVTSQILQPMSTRSRQRFRGHRESEKVNLEAHQFYADIRMLRSRAKKLDNDIAIQEEILYHGLDSSVEWDSLLSDVYYHWEADEATPSTDIVKDIYNTITDIIQRVEALDTRVKTMYFAQASYSYPGYDTFPDLDLYP